MYDAHVMIIGWLYIPLEKIESWLKNAFLSQAKAHANHQACCEVCDYKLTFQATSCYKTTTSQTIQLNPRTQASAIARESAGDIQG